MTVAMAKLAASTEGARAEFSRASISDEVTTKVLKQYPAYLHWPVDTKLRSALHLWIEHVGSQQLSERLNKQPPTLCRTPDECNDVYLWLLSVGIDAERIQQKSPKAMSRRLDDVQNTFWVIQQALQLSDKQLPVFFHRHFRSLHFSPGHVAQTLQTVAELLAVPVASKEMQDVVMVRHQQLFAKEPAELHHLVSFFCKEFKGGQQAAKAALKQDMFRISAESMRENADQLGAMLGWTEDELNKAVCVNPRVLTVKPSTLANNLQKLQAHSFTSVQAVNMCASYPVLAAHDWSSPLNVERLDYFRLVLQLSTAELSAKPRLFSASLERKIGPRSEFMYRSKLTSPDVPLGLSAFTTNVQTLSDVKFAARFNSSLASPPMIYNEVFKQHWWQRWIFLRHEMGLSVAEVSACRALLFTSLPNTLAPRWHFLNLLGAAQADFKATDHLKLLATLSDERFAQEFNVAKEGLVYDKNLSAVEPV